MSIFQPAKVTSAFLKMGIMGKQGAGKSKTAAKVAIGLHKYLAEKGVAYANKPVVMFDTEGGSDWLIPDFEKAGVPFFIAKKSSFADLLTAMREAEQNASILIIDSITHPYRELIASFLRKKQRTFLQIDDWNYLKGEHGWQQFTTLFLNSNLHIIMCGRAGDDLEQYTDDQGKRQLEKVGVKMKTEAETGFEPSLLVLMERNMNTRTNKVTHMATILKDRADLLDGQEFDDPGFQAFLPHIALLNVGGEHVGYTGTASESILKTEKRDWQPVQRKIVIGEISDLLQLHYAGQKVEDKTARIKALLRNFDAGWTEIEEAMSLSDLRAGYDRMYRELEGKPSKYAIRGDVSTDINDEIPAEGSGTAPETISLKDRLLKDLAQLTTLAEITHWATEVSTKYRKELNEADYRAISMAVFNRQGDIARAEARNGGNGGDKAPDAPETPAKPSQDDDGGAPTQPTKPEPEQAPQTARKCRSGGRAREDAPAEIKAADTGTMADLMTAG